MTLSLAVELAEPVFVTALGTAFFCFPGVFQRRTQARHAARMAELNAGAEERFFEERRSLEAYPPCPEKNWVFRLSGVVMFLLGAFQIFYRFYS